MKVGARITVATSALVILTLGTQALFDLRSEAGERRAAIEQETRAVALSVRASIEAIGAESALRNATVVAGEINRTIQPWRVALVPADAPQQGSPKRSPTQMERLRTVTDMPSIDLVTEEGDQIIYVVSLRAPAPRSPTGYRVAGSLEVARSVASLQDAFRANVIRTLLVLGLIVAMIVLAVAWLTGSLMTRPVKKLLSGIDDVAQGDLSRVLLSERDDEIGALATRFNEMTYYLRESRAETQRQNEARLELEQRLRQTEKMATIGLFAAEIAHEVGTPLNVIAGRARTLAKKAQSPELVQKNAAIISEQATRITRIIQQTLDRARDKVGTTDPVRVDLNEMALTTMELYEGKLAATGIQHTLHRGEDLPAVQGDADRLQQVLINLLNNAVQAMPQGGKLWVRTYAVTRRRPGLEMAPEQSYAVLEVGDSGVGIPPEKREQIFEPFYTSKHGEGGTGLGLAVCYSIVKDHDGWISIEDTADEGTVFAVYLPTGE